MASKTCSLCKQSGHNKRTCPSLVAEEKADCPICYEEIKDTNFCVTKCGHKFCMDCMPKHLQNNQKCPLCRSDIVDEVIRAGPPLHGPGSIEQVEHSYNLGYNEGRWDGYEDGHHMGHLDGVNSQLAFERPIIAREIRRLKKLLRDNNIQH